jgi:hypothetical protein
VLLGFVLVIKQRLDDVGSLHGKSTMSGKSDESIIVICMANVFYDVPIIYEMVKWLCDKFKFTILIIF